MAAENTPKPDKLSTFQKAAIGIFLSTATVYEFVLKSDEIKTSLGVGYPIFLMILTMFGLSCAALSGPQILELLESVKGFLSKKKE